MFCSAILNFPGDILGIEQTSMGIFNLFSKRQKQLRGDIPDVYVYDDIPDKLRVQIVHIVKDVLGTHIATNEKVQIAFAYLNNALCREYGIFKLSPNANHHDESLYKFFLETEDYEKALDVVELAFQYVDDQAREYAFRYNAEAKMESDDAINELNTRFREHGIGYQFESGTLIRVDSQFLHADAVKPVLVILGNPIYAGANEEFLKAHEHYRHGRNKECLNECLKAFESVMKSICSKRKWNYEKNDTAKSLISVCMENGLVPQYLQSEFGSLRSILESGVPTVRNKLGGHGQGAATITVPSEMAKFALHLTASHILFLAEHEQKSL